MTRAQRNARTIAVSASGVVLAGVGTATETASLNVAGVVVTALGVVLAVRDLWAVR